LVKEGFRRDAWQVLGAEPDSNPGEESSERSARLFNEALEKSDTCLLATAGFIEASNGLGKQLRLLRPAGF
jgi:hypothetical protein